MKHLRRHLSYANLIATVALFLALGGGAYAAIALPKNSVGAKQIKPNAVTGSKIANGSITASDLAPAARSGSDGVPGSQGPAGAQGSPGAMGAPGLDGAAVAVRARSTGPLETPSDNSPVQVSLSGSSWTQGGADLDLGPFLTLTFTAPGSSACGGSGLVDLNWRIEADGRPFAGGSIETLRDGAIHTVRRSEIGFLPEPGVATQHTATVTLGSDCQSGPFPVPITVSDLGFDLIRAS